MRAALPVPSLLAASALLACASAAAQTNLAERPSKDIGVLNGTWAGAHIEQRSNCTKPENNGNHGTYSQYVFSFSPPGHGLALAETAVQGLNCTWDGMYDGQPGQWTWTGNLSCSDGRTGTFESSSIFALNSVMSVRLSIQLTGTESCTIDALISGARF